MSNPTAPFGADVPPHYPGANRRVFVRNPVSTPCLCHAIPLKDSTLWHATLRDISIGGLCLVARHGFQKGEMLAIELPHAVEGARTRLFVRVRHVKVTREGLCVAGCSFIKKLRYEELEAFLRALPGWRPFADSRSLGR